MSRYPSAYGHTPSYRSVGGMPAYPSALGARDSDLLLGVTSFYQIQNYTLKLYTEIIHWNFSNFYYSKFDGAMRQKNRGFATNFDFLICISFKSNVIHLNNYF